MKDHNYIWWDFCFCLSSTCWSMRGVHLLTPHRKSQCC